jgi:ribose 5-phosphate isomerase B
MSKLNIAIANDHAGTALKFKLIEVFESKFNFINFGTDKVDSVDYPDYVHPLATSVETSQSDFGILICGSGNGVCMTANKHKNIRAALCWTKEICELARQHNNANVVCIPARFVSESEAIEIVTAFLNTEFEGGRHQNRVEKINC